MKKIFALALAIVMMMAIALPVFADYQDKPLEDTDPQKHFESTVPAAEEYDGFDNMLLTYGVQQEYIVTIPADVNFSKADLNTEQTLFVKTGNNVKAEGIVISGNEIFTVSVSSFNTWKLVDEAGKSTAVDYNAILADNPKTKGGEADEITYDKNTAQEQYVLIIDPAEGNKGWNEKAEDDVDITFTTAGTAQEGMFVDTLTFTVQIFEDNLPA